MEEKLVRLEDNKVVEILETVEGFEIKECFHADILKQCVPFQDGVKAGMIYNSDKKTFEFLEVTDE